MNTLSAIAFLEKLQKAGKFAVGGEQSPNTEELHDVIAWLKKTTFPEKELDRVYQLGISEGWKRASGWLGKEAQEAFIRQNDDMAKTLRAYSHKASVQSTSEHPGERE